MPRDVLAAASARRSAPTAVVEARVGLVVEERTRGFGGVVIAVDAGTVTIRNDLGEERLCRLDGAFAVAGRAVRLVRPEPDRARPGPPSRTASGALADAPQPARVARQSRILVEGDHDAALLERVWGDDLRGAGVVVQPLGGAERLGAFVRDFRPDAERRLGVLLDHLVEGTKESRLAAAVAGPHVLVTGHPWVDVWQGVRPRAVGIARWPEIGRGVEWKAGVCRELGWADPHDGWRRVLGAVDSYADLEPPLVGAVERLLDFLL